MILASTVEPAVVYCLCRITKAHYEAYAKAIVSVFPHELEVSDINEVSESFFHCCHYIIRIIS